MMALTRTTTGRQGSNRSNGSNGSGRVRMVALLVVLAGVGLGAQSQASTYRETLDGMLVSFEMVRVPGAGAIPDLWVGRTEVTWDLYDVYALGLDQKAPQPEGIDAIGRPSNPYGAPDYGWGHAGFPVISVTRQAAEAFAKWLSLKTGREYRLPTDAEWTHVAERAARGITPAEIAWHAGNAGMVTHAVGRKGPDGLGLFDLFGNAGEWVMTPGDTLVIRGGTYRSGPDTVGPTARAEQDYSWNERDPQLPKSQWWLSDGPHVGFRLVRTIRE